MLAIMIQAKTIDYRDHPKLPPGSKIQFPQNQEFKMEKETFASKRKKHEIEELKGTNEATAASKADFLANVPELGGNKAARKESPNKEGGITGAATAVQNMRKTHSAWDRTKREWAGLIAQSEANTNTRGSKFESDLRAAILNGTRIDESMVTLETLYAAKSTLANDEIEQGAKLAAALVEAMKNGAKRVVALKACFKVVDIA